MTAVAQGIQTLTDAQAIERSFTDPEAFVSVFERHFTLVHRYLQARAGRSAADDLAAETFEVAFRRRGDYDTSYVDARPWLFGIALNVARDAQRREGRQRRAFLRLARDPSRGPRRRKAPRRARFLHPVPAGDNRWPALRRQSSTSVASTQGSRAAPA